MSSDSNGKAPAGNGESEHVDAGAVDEHGIPTGSVYDVAHQVTPAGAIALSDTTHIWGTEGWPWAEGGHLYLQTNGQPVQVSLVPGAPTDIESTHLSEAQRKDLRRAGYDGPGPVYHLWPSVGVGALPGSSNHPIAHIRLMRADEDGGFPVMVGGFRFHAPAGDSVSLPPSFLALDYPPPGIWRYSFGARARPGSRVWAQRICLQAFELVG